MRESRERRMAIRELRERVERDVLALKPAERGRGLAWFRTADGSADQRFTLQLPPHRTLVRWDDRPYVSPLAEVAGRGRPAGLVLVSVPDQAVARTGSHQRHARAAGVISPHHVHHGLRVLGVAAVQQGGVHETRRACRPSGHPTILHRSTTPTILAGRTAASPWPVPLMPSCRPPSRQDSTICRAIIGHTDRRSRRPGFDTAAAGRTLAREDSLGSTGRNRLTRAYCAAASKAAARLALRRSCC
jgi:hypothetical protein